MPGVAAVEVADPHLGRREQRTVDLVEVVLDLLEDVGERPAVVARVARRQLLRELARALPSRNSRDHGRSFAHIFKEVEYDFYKIDGALFAPAEVWVSNIDSGNTWHGGTPDMALLQRLWLQQA